MEIPLQAQVECRDGVCSCSEYVLIDPITEKDFIAHTEYTVADKSRPWVTCDAHQQSKLSLR